MPLVLSLLLSACSDLSIRRGADRALRSGNYEAALDDLERGLKEYPDSTALRSGLIQARQQAQGALIRLADEAQARGDLGAASQALLRAQKLDPDNPRLRALLSDLETARRQGGVLAEVQALLGKQPELALQRVQQALSDNPKHPELQALRRQIELSLREREHLAAREALAEQRPISLDFRDASLRLVLDAISRHSGVNYVLDKDVRQDLRVSLLMRDARVEDALDLLLSTNQLAKKLVDARTLIVYPASPDKQREYQEQVVRVFHLNSGDARAAAGFLRAMLKVAEPFVDERSNMLAMRDTPENIRLAERLIALFDAGEAEVLLELEVLEVSTRRLTELGVKFPDSFSLTPLAPIGESRLTLENVMGLGRERVALGVGGLLVNLKREVGDFSTLANPRIRVKNREKAKVLVGDKIPVITTVTGQAGFVSDNINYLDVGLKLDVEPTIYSDDEVAIKVALEVSSLGTATKTASGALAYQIGTRNASTLLRLRDGETQLLAGLISKDERSSAARLPGAGDLPVLGRLFSSNADNQQRTELVLAITPRVLRNMRRLQASEAEVWVGTEAAPRLRSSRPVALRPLPAVGAPPATALQANDPVPTVPAPLVVPAASDHAVPVPKVVTTWRGPERIKMGEAFEVTVQVQSQAEVRGLPVELLFDPQMLALLEVLEGDFLNRDGTKTSMAMGGDARLGQRQIGLLRMPASGVTGEGALLRFRLRALRPGITDLRLREVRAIQPDGWVLDTSTPATLQLKVEAGQ